MGKVVDFNSALKHAKEQEEHECEHCQLRKEWVASMITVFQQILVNSKDEDEALTTLIEFCSEMYDDAEEDGSRSAYADMLGYAGFNIDEIDGANED